MRLYRIANLAIASDIPLPAPRPGNTGRDAWRLHVRSAAGAPRPRAWYHEDCNPDGTRWRSLARRGGEQVVRFWGAATFTVNIADRQVTCYRWPATSDESVRQLFIGHVVPLLFAARGTLPLHASAVRTAGGVIAFVGESRRGKTTIAAALAAAGYPLVADDCVLVEAGAEECRVRPMNVGLRVWSGNRKRRVRSERLGLASDNKPAPLRRVYLLQPSAASTSVAIDRVSPPEAVVCLLGSAFHYNMDRREELARSFDRLTRLASQVDVRRLTPPRGLEHLPQVVAGIVADCGAGHGA